VIPVVFFLASALCYVLALFGVDLGGKSFITIGDLGIALGLAAWSSGYLPWTRRTAAPTL